VRGPLERERERERETFITELGEGRKTTLKGAKREIFLIVARDDLNRYRTFRFQFQAHPSSHVQNQRLESLAHDAHNERPTGLLGTRDRLAS